jgi:hypothetical protein
MSLAQQQSPSLFVAGLGQLWRVSVGMHRADDETRP